MGGWKLEATKMSLYIAFPVSMFWLFNQPAFFEEWMIKKRREMFPPKDPKVTLAIQDAVMEMEKLQQEKLEKE